MDQLLAPDYADQTSVHPVAALVFLGAAALIAWGPRALVVSTLLVVSCLITPAQRVSIGGVDFTLLRLLLMVAGLRMFLQCDVRKLQLQALDMAVLVTLTLLSVVPLFDPQVGSVADAAIQKLGLIGFDSLLLYAVLRVYLRKVGDIERVLRMLPYLIVPLTLAFIVEKATQTNSFAIFGGVSAETRPTQGRIRAQGAFVHPIIAGCFFAGLVPLLTLWPTSATQRRIWWAAAAAAVVLIFTTVSSTPIGGLGIVILAVLIYPFRQWLRPARWAVFAMLLLLHFARDKPVWHLLGRVQLVGGSTGWHRYMLIDAFANNFDEWWLVGTPSTAHWGFGLVDVTCQYVSYGLNGGIWGLLAFFVLLCVLFGQIGRALRRTRGNERAQRILFAAGAAVGVHLVCFIGVSYFGQGVFAWYFSLAVAAAVTSPEAFAEAEPAADQPTAEDASSPVPPPTDSRPLRSPSPASAGIIKVT
jgi:hypothetical protein